VRTARQRRARGKLSSQYPLYPFAGLISALFAVRNAFEIRLAPVCEPPAPNRQISEFFISIRIEQT
jgi:hypothetical protein